MGTEEGLLNLMNELEKLHERIESGELPETAMPRYFYSGHKYLGEYPGFDWFKCQCGHTWKIGEGQCIDDRRKAKRDLTKANGDLYYSCPKCEKSQREEDIRWYHEYDQEVKWECLGCKHQWRSKNGEVCPSCKLDYREWKNS